MSRPFPLIEYAQKIGKNTAELTAVDMTKFMKWYMMQPQRKDLLIMAKSYTTKKFEEAQTSRLAEQGIESPINNGEEEIVLHGEKWVEEIVCEMGLTRKDVDALIWGIKQLFSDYELGEMGVSLSQLLEALEGV
jgi:hypothetical protein